MSSLTRIAAKANQMIKRYGQPVTVSRVTPGTVDISGKPTDGPSFTNSSTGVFLPLSSYSDNREEVNTLAQRQVRYLLVSAKGMTLNPQPQDNVTVGTDKYRVQSSTPINPNGAAIAHQTLVVKL